RIDDKPASSSGNTYAIVIGIASYQDPDIRPLSFSNRDAEVFADFLMSASGGSVPEQNIKLLIDSGATVGEIDKSLRWLLNKAEADDKVYFYFSGHGEMENVTMNKNGFLICYNTPSVAFINMGLSINYLNDVANTLSVQTRAKVIMITDACHSGNMTGNRFSGNFFVGEQLMLKKENEIRMASSLPDQLSNENVDWGGGRGVFSYYLVNGMQGGLADENKDGTVSLGELKDYMETKMANDPVLKKEGDVQTPAIKGNADFNLSTVVKTEARRVIENVRNDSIAMSMAFQAQAQADEEYGQPDEYFFSLLKKERLETLTEELKLNERVPDTISFVLIAKLASLAGNNNGMAKMQELEGNLRNNKGELNRFNLDLASVFLDAGQNVITNYIKGDAAELERRRYYNSDNNGYDVYPKMFETAAKLSATDKYFSTKANVLFHYFSGVALRLKIPTTENPMPLVEKAFKEQQAALALEEYAAYIYNELGILYTYKQNVPEAEKNFIKATQLSPQWAIPQANLCVLYASMGKYDKGLKAGEIADSLQANLQTTNTSIGYVYEKTGNNLFAEEFYRKAIDLNSRHFVPFERLGNVYLNITDYAASDSFFYEADLRKKGYHFDGNEWASLILYSPTEMDGFSSCPLDTSVFNKKDILAFFFWGVREYEQKNYSNAVRILSKVVALDNSNPLVFHCLGKIYYDQQKWEEAELMFTYALQYHIDAAAFEMYTDSVINSFTYPYEHRCIDNFFGSSYYNKIEDYYFAGTLYEKWNHTNEAEIYFRKIIDLDQDGIGGYLKLWQLQEKLERYVEAEKTITYYTGVNEEQGERELNEFYRRVLEKYPEDGNWNHRLGLLLYSKAQAKSKSMYLDSIVWFPKINKEIFIDLDTYARMADRNHPDKDLILYDKLSTGSPREVTLNFERHDGGGFSLPGTGNYIPLAGPVYLPRFDGIKYLSKAADILAEKNILADVNFKIGNMYVWAGSKKQAYPYYVKSLNLLPSNANARLNLVNVSKAIYKNRAALTQLNYLYDSGQINFPKRMLFAEFSIHAGQFEKADRLLTETEAYYPYILPEIADLRGRRYMLADKSKEAIQYYKNYINISTNNEQLLIDHSETFKVDGKKVKSVTYSVVDKRRIPAYSLARLYAKVGNSKEAYKWLETAVEYGFNYSFVLKYDPYMDKLRNSSKWESLMKNIVFRDYTLKTKPVTDGSN
ncbi:MAG: caspase family protein, partial [Ferruginibacter sp.]